MDLVDRITKKVLEKKELRGISEEYVKKKVKEFLDKHKKIKECLEKKSRIERASEFKEVVKKIRAELRKERGLFIGKSLEEHLSTKERLPCYKKLYKKLWKICGKPKKIVDLGCGLNPLSYEYMDLNNVEYYAIDIGKEEIEIVKKYFKEKKIKGRAIVMDLSDEENYKNIPKADVALLFKLVDSIDKKKGHKIPIKLIESLKCNWIVVSFALKTVSQKKMKGVEYRGKWLENYLEKNKIKYEKFEMCNELFFVIKNEIH